MVIDYQDVTLRQAISINDMESLNFQDEFGYLIFANFSKNKETNHLKYSMRSSPDFTTDFLAFNFF